MKYAVIKLFNGLAAANPVVGPEQSVAVLMRTYVFKPYESNGGE
jgi:hypothetical protein